MKELKKFVKKSKKVAIFDIDGTIFRSSLLIELVEALVSEGVFPKNTRTLYEQSYKNWFNRQGSYEDYIISVVRAFEKNISGTDHKVFLRITKKVIAANKDRVYRYTRDLIEELKQKNYFLIAISHSPKDIVQNFCKELGFDKVYGRDYEVGTDNKFTNKTLYLDLISDKAKMLKYALKKRGFNLVGSIGVGDSESDIAFLKLVEHPICFNANQKLYERAKRSGWKIVVERKDVIYEI